MWTRPATEAKTGSMGLILNMPSTPGYRNASTCGFSARKGRCAHGFRNLPHTSGERFRKCGENQDRPIRTRFYASATCGFVAENRVALGGFRFFPALPENAALHRELKRKSQHPRQHPVVAKTSKGRCRKTEQRPFFVSASRRVRGDCITGNILP